MRITLIVIIIGVVAGLGIWAVMGMNDSETNTNTNINTNSNANTVSETILRLVCPSPEDDLSVSRCAFAGETFYIQSGAVSGDTVFTVAGAVVGECSDGTLYSDTYSAADLPSTICQPSASACTDMTVTCLDWREENPESNTNAVSNANLNTNTDSATTNTTVATLSLAMTEKEYSFSPSSFSAKPGQKVEITLKNSGSMEHDFRITELGVNSGLIGAGETKTVTFTVPTTQKSYEYFCSLSNHRAMGMKGTLTVTD